VALPAFPPQIASRPLIPHDLPKIVLLIPCSRHKQNEKGIARFKKAKEGTLAI
jgi:hypothetical protein